MKRYFFLITLARWLLRPRHFSANALAMGEEYLILGSSWPGTSFLGEESYRLPFATFPENRWREIQMTPQGGSLLHQREVPTPKATMWFSRKPS